MSFFQDLIAGRGKLHEAITPSWLRKAAPKELQPNGFMPARDWFGIDGDGSLKAAAQAQEAQRIAAEQAYGQNLFNQAGTMAVPGVTGPMSAGAGIPGLLGKPQQEMQANQLGNQQQPVGDFQPTGMAPRPERARALVGNVVNQWMHENMSPSDWVSLLPNQQQNVPPVQAGAMMPNGPYGQQAMMMAGLLGRSGLPRRPPPIKAYGLLRGGM